VQVAVLETPIGRLSVARGPDGLVSVDFDIGVDELHGRLERRLGKVELEATMHPLARAVAAYFRGDVGAIDALAVVPMGTPFQRQVWAALRRIPAGQTISYSELALRVGRPASVRAVGGANGQNPVAVVVPCHRVIGMNGSLTGYGGGLERKRWLLVHEKAIVA
jgi:methylated-DNA-[protein]-cysteine S-methyltransferase